MGSYKTEEEKLIITNDELMKEMQNLGKEKVILSSYGNSISTGFSMMSENKPLLRRNEDLKKAAATYNIELEQHQFSRSENNSDEHLLNSFILNKKESEFNKDSRRDYRVVRKNLVHPLSDEELDEYYPTTLESDKGVQDVFYDTDETAANIVIYNGATGSLLDNWTRKGKHILTGGIKKDTASIETLLGLIQLNNREKFSNTQVYLCGAPNIMNLPVTSSLFINGRLKAISKRFANVTYVPTIPRKPLYFEKGHLPLPDPHYDKNEYLHLLNETEKQIIKNYHIKELLIAIDRTFAKRSKEIEFTEQEVKSYDEVLSVIEAYAKKAESDGIDRNEFLKIAIDYLLERYPYDYYFLDHKAMKDGYSLLKRK